MIKNIIKYANLIRLADAFSSLSRGNFLNNQINSQGLFSKFNLIGKQKNQLSFFVADLIDNIVFKYISKSRSDQYQWFLDNFKKQNKHLQDIINVDEIQQSDFLNRRKGVPIEDFERFKNDLGSCVQILQNVKKFNEISKQLPSEFKKKISQFNFQSLNSFVSEMSSKKQQIVLSGQPKTLQKIIIPGVSSYKVYKCLPPQNKSDWRNCPQFIQLNQKFSKKASWCVIRGTIPYGSYLNPKWNFYVLVTTNSNQPVMFFNFSQDHNGQIKDINDYSFSSYDQQLFKIVDYFIKEYNFDPRQSSDYDNYLRIKDIYNNSIDLNKYQQVYETKNYVYYKEIGSLYYIIYNNNNQCKFYIHNDYNPNFTRIGTKKDKISEQIIGFLINKKMDNVIMFLLRKKIIQKQNGILYDKLLKYMFDKDAFNSLTQQFFYLYLTQLQIVDSIKTYKQCLRNLQSYHLKQLIEQQLIKDDYIQDGLKKLLVTDSEYFIKITGKPKYHKAVQNMLKDNIIKLNSEYGNLAIVKLNQNQFFIDSSNYTILSQFDEDKYDLINDGLQNQQAKYCLNNKISFPLICFANNKNLNNQLLEQIDNYLYNGDFDLQQLNQKIYRGQNSQQVKKLLNYYIKINNKQQIVQFLQNFNSSASTDFGDLFEYVSKSNDSELCYKLLTNSNILYNDDAIDYSYDYICYLVSTLGRNGDFDYVYDLDWNDSRIASEVFNCFLDNNRIDDANQVLDYLDSDDLYYAVRSLLTKYKQQDLAEKIIETFEKYGYKYVQSYDFQDDDFYPFVQYLLNSKIGLNDYFDSMCKTIQEKIIQYIKLNKKFQVCKTFDFQKLEDDVFEDIYKFLLKNQQTQILKMINPEDIPSDLLNDAVEFFVFKGQIQYIIPISDDDSQIQEDVYSNYNDDYKILFQFGAVQTLDEEEIKIDKYQIFKLNVQDYIKGTGIDLRFIDKCFKFYTKNNLDKNKLKQLMFDLFQDNKNNELLQGLIYFCTSYKMIDCDKQLFDLLLNNDKINLLSKIEDYKKSPYRQQVIQKVKQNTDDTNFNLDDLTQNGNYSFSEFCDVLPNQEFIKMLQISDPDGKNQQNVDIAIEKRSYAVLKFIVDYTKFYVRTAPQALNFMKKIVQLKLNKQYAKQFYNMYNQKIGDFDSALLQYKKIEDREKTLNQFKKYIDQQTKLSKKLYDLSKAIINN